MSETSTHVCDTCVFDDPSPRLERWPVEKRYNEKELLGRGGMGVVLLCKDSNIGREVAMKKMHAERARDPQLRARFLREACIQGQLEHPAIVPVHDLGHTEQGEVFFTMKRVRGVSLGQVIAALRAADPETVAKYSSAKLLSIFLSVCNGVDFAHASGVVHRDLKPANVMLGDFGEVYILDFGVAKLLSDDPTASVATERSVAKTLDGTVLGTPGYMAPEQELAAPVDARADVYALGAILFEILTLVPLRPSALRKRPLSDADARPSLRTPERDVAPELEEICVKATRLNPNDRYATVRELAQAIEKFINGDRDLALRRTLAADHAARAAELVAKSCDHNSRTLALREASAAIALDPKNERALSAMALLLLEPPDTLPKEVEDELEEQRLLARKRGARTGIFANGIVFVAILLVVWMGVRDLAPMLIAVFGLVASTLASTITVVAKRPHDLYSMVGLGGRLLVMLGLGRAFGPLVLVPATVVTVAIAFLPSVQAELRKWVLLSAPATVVVPLVLELFGVIAPSYGFVGGNVCALPQLAAFDPAPTALLAIVVTIGPMFSALGILRRMQLAHDAADRKLRVHSWYLRSITRPTSR